MVVRNNIKKDLSNSEIEINFDYILNLILRNKKFITILSLISLILPIVLIKFSKKVWQGQFEIVLKKDINPISNRLTINPNFSNFLGLNDIKSSINTELEILKSPSVLMPIFEFVNNQNNFLIGC